MEQKGRKTTTTFFFSSSSSSSSPCCVVVLLCVFWRQSSWRLRTSGVSLVTTFGLGGTLTHNGGTLTNSEDEPQHRNSIGIPTHFH